MRKIHYIISLFVLAVTFGCTDDNSSIDLDAIEAPTNISALTTVKQDNTGKVTFLPKGEGVTQYEIYFGDGTAKPAIVNPGQTVTHVYSEGVYQSKIVGTTLNGKRTEVTQEVVVSFRAPENLKVVITHDLAVSKKVTVTAMADFALFYDVYFGEAGKPDPLSANNGASVSYVYQTAGVYTIRVVSKSAAIQTKEFVKEFEAILIEGPTSAASIPARSATNVISMFSDSYTNVPMTTWKTDWSQATKGEKIIAGNNIIQYSNLNFVGAESAATIDASTMTFLHVDVWSSDFTEFRIKLVDFGANGVWEQGGDNVEHEVKFTSPAQGSWVSLDIPLSDFTNLTTREHIAQLIFSGNPSGSHTIYIDNVYFYKEAVTSSVLEGTWKIAPEAGALKVGPSSGSGDWWANDAQAVIDRACYFNDTFVFSSNGSFSNVQGTDTWLEKWQGIAAEACGAQVAPHDGSVEATYLHDAAAGTLKINGAGAYLGLPKVNNAGELPNVAVPASITYNVTLLDNNNTMNVVIEAGAGVFWSFKLVRI
jgi:hypothetical protein